MGRKSRFASKALEFAYDRYVGDDKAKAEVFEAELADADVARKLYDLRTKAGLTQSALPSSWGRPRRSSVGSRMESTRATPSRCSGVLPLPSTKGWKSASSLSKERRPRHRDKVPRALLSLFLTMRRHRAKKSPESVGYGIESHPKYELL